MFPTQFTGASFTWERKKLGIYVPITMGQSPNSKNYTNNPRDNILVQGNADLYNNRVLKRTFTTEVTKIADRNDILISVRAPVGDIARNQYESIVIGRGIAAIKGNNFLYYQLEKMNNSGFWKKYIAGSTFESITGKDLKSSDIYISNHKEEKSIGDIFQTLTKTIQLHEDHLQFLHSFKSFLLQKMFFDNDIPPLLRFNKFTEKWNQCKLNDHTIVTMGQSPNSKNYTNNQTGKILVQGNADLYKNKILKRVFTTEVTKTAVKNDILISVRAPVGDIARNQYESVVIGRGIASIKGNDFLYYQLEKMKNNGFWNKYIAGSTFESITGKDLKNTKIYTTNSDEERKIGNIFSSLTKIIQLQEHKIDSLKKLKQFLLQNMFI
ncbi:restriction endonuclease subunit S [Ligilactobacillus salivarius]|uniref:restriction endonuclease subunit S n=1 Tax=Ligilactobacillus salivarius TaxID=1624 RepID=UPI0013719988|nr:restriction endonuclease subunit S [Ligilactobacillus salivarius]MDE1522941.1 restriction endonuclease subunit S [Ligilactobacillus salivarius]MYZ20132.1 restriction endonuclease subunit S [Ligilactobacillus salivarius]